MRSQTSTCACNLRHGAHLSRHWHRRGPVTQGTRSRPQSCVRAGDRASFPVAERNESDTSTVRRLLSKRGPRWGKCISKGGTRRRPARLLCVGFDVAETSSGKGIHRIHSTITSTRRLRGLRPPSRCQRCAGSHRSVALGLNSLDGSSGDPMGLPETRVANRR